MIWRDEAAMRAFVRSGAHRRIMARLPEWCDEAALVRWVQDASDPPSWVEAHRRLQGEGHRSRVSHPSGAQRWFEIRAPADRGGAVQMIAGARSPMTDVPTICQPRDTIG
jgi:hypothetical protein